MEPLWLTVNQNGTTVAQCLKLGTLWLEVGIKLRSGTLWLEVSIKTTLEPLWPEVVPIRTMEPLWPRVSLNPTFHHINLHQYTL